MPNELLNPVAISAESLMRWENNLVFAKYVTREFDDKFARPGDKIGYTYDVRIPNRFRGRVGDKINPEAIKETVVPVTVNRLWGQDLQISDQDLAMTIDRFGERYVEPGVQIIGNMIDAEGLDLSIGISNAVGTPGTTPSTLATYTAAGVVLANHGTPTGTSRSAVVSPEMEAAALGFGPNLFNPAKEISDQYRTGKMGTAVGLKWSMDQNVTRQTVGAVGGNPVVSGANQSGTSIATSGWPNSTLVLKAGDVVQFTGVNGVNPVSFRDFGALRGFAVTADVTSDGSGLATLPLAVPINASTEDATQTVMALPANGATIRVYNVPSAGFANITGVSSPQGIVFHKEAFALVIAKLEMPGGMEWSEEVSNPKVGMSIRLVRGYDIRENQKYTRLDVLGGWTILRPEFACRVAG